MKKHENNNLLNLLEDTKVHFTLYKTILSFRKKNLMWQEEHKFYSYYYYYNNNVLYDLEGNKIDLAELENLINNELDWYINRIAEWCKYCHPSRNFKYKSANVEASAYEKVDILNVVNTKSTIFQVDQYPTRNASYYFKDFLKFDIMWKKKEDL